MHPYLLPFAPISTYGVCIVAGLILAWLWAHRRAAAAGIDPSRLDLLMPILAGTGLLGAWLFGWLADAASDDSQHAAVLVGSLLTATTAGVLYGFAARIPLGILGDICSAPLALGIAIGRLGCFFAGCCFGKVCTHPTPLTAVQFPPGSFAYLQQLHDGLLAPSAAQSLPVYPVQLYESLACLALALLIAAFPARLIPGRAIPGERFLAVGIGYAMARFALEFLRADNPPIAGLTFSQWTAIAIVVLAAATWLIRRRLLQVSLLAPAVVSSSTSRGVAQPG